MKTCTKCKVEKPLTEFYLTSSGGLASACKACAKERSRASALANPERVAASQKKFHLTHPERRAAYSKKWQVANRDITRAAQNKWRRANPDKRAATEARQRAAHPERYRAQKARYYARNSDLLRAKVSAYNAANPERKKERDRAYYAAHKDKWAGVAQRWQKKFPAKHAAKQRARFAAKLNATPAWANKFFIEEAYDLAARRTAMKCGGIEKWEVDHVVPLKSRLVCGLHVENNLQVIPALVNRSKSNRFWPDMPAPI